MAQRIETIRNTQSVVVNVPGQASIEVDIRRLTPDIRHRLTMHGLGQKLADAAAKERDPITGKPAGFDVKYTSIRKIADALLAGEWTVRAERLAADTITDDRVEAVAAARHTEPGTVRDWLEGLTAEARAKVFTHPSVAVELARMRAERLARPDDDDDPFAGLPTTDEDQE